jgi:hypothetical protein
LIGNGLSLDPLRGILAALVAGDLPEAVVK